MVGMSRLCTVRIGTSTRAGRIDGDDIVILDAADVGDVLRADSEVAETGEAIPGRPPAWLRWSRRPTRWCVWA